MALVIKDRVKETTTTTGTGTYTLAGAEVGFQSFSAIGNGNTTYYAVTNNNDWEVGIGTYTASGTTLARTTILSSSNSNNAVNWSSGEKSVIVTQPSSKASFLDASGDLNLSGNITVSGTVDGRDIATNIPASLGTAGQVLTVNSGASAGEWADAGGGGADLYDANESSPAAQPSATGTNAIAIGDSAISSNTNSFALGKSQASTEQGFAVQINNNTTSYGASGVFGSTAIGNTAKATGSVAIALGQGSIASGSKALAFGTGATASSGNSVAIGYNTTANVTDGVAIGGSGKPVRISGTYTLPTSDGSNGQVLTTNGSGVISFATPSGGGGSSPDLYADNDVDATAPSATGNNSVAIGPSSEANSDDATAFGYRSEAKGPQAVAIGEGRAGGTSATAISIGTTSTAYGATGQNSVAIGYQAKATAYLSFGLGQNSVATGLRSHAFGNSLASGTESLAMAIDNNSTSYGASGNNSVAIAQSAVASGQISVAIGKQATASGVQSLSIGSGTCSNNKSISLGFGNIVDGQGAVAIGVGAKTWGTSSKIVFGGNYGYSDGRLQSGIIQVHNNTTDATPVVLSSNSTSTAGSSNQLILPNNSSFTFTGIVSAREKASEGTDVGAWEVKGVVRREGSASTTTLVNSVINEINVPTGWAVAVSADTTNGALAITVTGVASTNIRWSTTLYTTEVMYA